MAFLYEGVDDDRADECGDGDAVAPGKVLQGGVFPRLKVRGDSTLVHETHLPHVGAPVIC